MAENKVSIEISGRDEKLLSALKQSESQIKTWGSKTIQTVSRVNASVAGMGDKYMNAVAGLGIGYGLVKMTQDMMDFDGGLRSIRRTAGLTEAQTAGLREQIMGLISPEAKEKIALTKGAWVDMAKALNATGIEYKTIRDVLPEVGKGAIAGAINPQLYAGTIGELIDKYKVAVSELPELQEQLNKAMKMEDVRKDPEAYLRSIEGLAKTMKLMGAGGMANVTPLLALLSHLTATAGSPGEAAAGLDAIFNGLLRLNKNPQLRKVLEQKGISFFNKEGAIKPLQEILPEVMKLADLFKSLGKSEELFMLFFGRPEASKTAMLISKDYEKIITKQKDLRTSTGGLAKDFNMETEAMQAKFKQFQNQIDYFKTMHMEAPLRYLNMALDELNKHPIIAKGLLGAAGVFGGLAVVSKILGMGKGILGIFGGGKGLPGGIAGGTGAAIGMPVFVTNWPGVPGSEWGRSVPPILGEAMKKAGPLLSKILPFALRWAGPVGAVVGTSISAYETGSWLNKKFIGTAIGDAVYDIVHPEAGKQEKNQIILNMYIDKEGRTFTEGDLSTDLEINTMRRGRFGPG